MSLDVALLIEGLTWHSGYQMAGALLALIITGERRDHTYIVLTNKKIMFLGDYVSITTCHTMYDWCYGECLKTKINLDKFHTSSFWNDRSLFFIVCIEQIDLFPEGNLLTQTPGCVREIQPYFGMASLVNNEHRDICLEQIRQRDAHPSIHKWPYTTLHKWPLGWEKSNSSQPPTDLVSA